MSWYLLKPIRTKWSRGNFFMMVNYNFFLKYNFSYILILFNFSDFNSLSFKAETDDPIVFLECYENCFNRLTEVDKMKINLIKFVKEEHFDQFNSYIQSNEYEKVRKMFIELHISYFTKNREDELNITFKEDKIQDFIRKKIKVLKKFLTTDESLKLYYRLCHVKYLISILLKWNVQKIRRFIKLFFVT